MSVRLGFLGGLGEIGRNCALLEIDGELALIDCGLMFPEEDMLGVDLVLPDFSSIADRRGDVRCVILTHGHEDHVGSLPYFLREANVPVYGSALTIALASSRVEEQGIDAELRAVEPLEWVEEGPFRFALVRVAHSVPHAAAGTAGTSSGRRIRWGRVALLGGSVTATLLLIGGGYGYAALRRRRSVEAWNAEKGLGKE